MSWELCGVACLVAAGHLHENRLGGARRLFNPTSNDGGVCDGHPVEVSENSNNCAPVTCATAQHNASWACRLWASPVVG